METGCEAILSDCYSNAGRAQVQVLTKARNQTDMPNSEHMNEFSQEFHMENSELRVA
jgi:hypothetical protein